jgi:hypothetical protein
MTTAKVEVLVIDLNPREQECHRCGAVCPVKFGLPVDVGGDYVPNWYEGEWAGVPACEPCHRKHEAWSRRTQDRKETNR